MDIELSKDISNARVLSGFPGFGLVATIASEYLIEHLEGEVVGKYWFEELPAQIAIHEGKVINPITLFYSEKYNLLIIHAISGTQGIEWKAAQFVRDICQKVNAQELITLEGVAISSQNQEEGSESSEEPPSAYYHSTTKDNIPELDEASEGKLNEGIILGVTASLMLTTSIPMTNVFVETHSQLPDSKAAAKLIEILDKYMGMNVDYEPLLQTAEKFEEKLKGIMEQSQQAQEVKNTKDLSYLG